MRRNEKGFTIIELMIAISIVAAVSGAATMSVFQVIEGVGRSNDHMIATRQVQNAGYWISHDTNMAQTIVTGDDPGTPNQEEFVTFKWTNWESGDVHTVVYIFEDMPDELKKFKRQHLTHDTEGTEIGNEMTFVAQNIESASFAQPSFFWKLVIQTRSGEETESREYKIIPRSSL